MAYVGDWHTHPQFIAASADEAVRAVEALPAELRERATLVFTAHSIPASMAARYPYQQQFEATAGLIADAVRSRCGLALPRAAVYQSRSGRPEDPWLGPDVCEFLRQGKADGRLEAAVIVPAGFICDHIEVLYDLDTEAAEVCRAIDLPMVRARAVNDHPLFVDMMADVVMTMRDRYAGARPLTIAPPSLHS